MKANEMTVDDRAAAGAAWLDDVYPEWWRVVDLDMLDMGSGCRCVVGQTFTPDPAIEDDDLLRESGFDALLWTIEAAGIESPRWTMGHGFVLNAHDVSWEPLEAAWRRIIKTRRSTSNQLQNQPQGGIRHE